MLFKLSNLALTLGYLNPALNNSAPLFNLEFQKATHSCSFCFRFSRPFASDTSPWLILCWLRFQPTRQNKTECWSGYLLNKETASSLLFFFAELLHALDEIRTRRILREKEDCKQSKGTRLQAASYFSLQSYCTRNLSTRAAKPWAVKTVKITSWFAIGLDEIKTRRILREKADCKKSNKRLVVLTP